MISRIGSSNFHLDEPQSAIANQKPQPQEKKGERNRRAINQPTESIMMG